MPTIVTVDTTNETITLGFTDRIPEPTAPPANLGAVSFTSDNPAIATVAVDPNNPLVGDITPTGAGVVNLGIGPLVDTAGAPLLEADGTAFPQPDAQQLTVNPGAAVGDRLTLAP
jgi:hypothetical protein